MTHFELKTADSNGQKQNKKTPPRTKIRRGIL